MLDLLADEIVCRIVAALLRLRGDDEAHVSPFSSIVSVQISRSFSRDRAGAAELGKNHGIELQPFALWMVSTWTHFAGAGFRIETFQTLLEQAEIADDAALLKLSIMLK